eukprot:851318-Alexandrium_andersonii.AAC.1
MHGHHPSGVPILVRPCDTVGERVRERSACRATGCSLETSWLPARAEVQGGACFFARGHVGQG